MLKFILAAFFSIALIFVLNNPIPLEDKNIPPIGKLLDPFGGFWQNCESEDDFVNQEITLPQLSAPAEVIYDDRLVPHIFANSAKDAAFLQGYIYARHRLWQMDISTRDIGGRLAEILGESLLERDLQNRRMGMRTAAMNTLQTWIKSPEHIRLIEAYATGVNAWIDQLSPADYPIEFKLLDYEPEHWTPLKSALFSRQMAKALCSRDNDFASSNALKIFGREMYDFLYPEYNPDQSPVIPADVEWNFEPENFTEKQDTSIMMGFIPDYEHEPGLPGIGSNNWAVSGSKTASGNAILCSDPHLRLSLPSIWYEMQFHCPEFNTYGTTLPGLPGNIIGFNENIAWGMTNVAQDVQDWYKIKWVDETKMHYIVDGQRLPVELVVEPVLVKGAETVLDTVRYTHYGPVVYDDFALRWIGHDENNPGGEMKTFVDLFKAKTYEDYDAALTHYDVPAQNIIFANQAGDIAIQVAGKFPIKPADEGKFVMDGSSGKTAWQGYIPKTQIPKVKNPERGYVSSANQHSTTPDYPYKYHGRFEQYRGRSLNEQLDTMQQITIADMKLLQNSTYSQKAADALPLLLGYLDASVLESDQARSYQKMLANWDYHFEREWLEPVLFTVWFQAFYDLTWDEIAAKANGENVQYPRSWRMIALMRDDPAHSFFDELTTPEKETARDIARKSFVRMVVKVAALEEEYDVLNWRHYKGTTLQHLGRIPAFTLDNVDIGGDASALNANTSIAGPSWRMIVELSDPIKAIGVYPGGQSGNPGSRFYDDMVDEWAEGKYFELQFFKTAAAAREKAFFTYSFKSGN